jgi:hypothetical protein
MYDPFTHHPKFVTWWQDTLMDDYPFPLTHNTTDVSDLQTKHVAKLAIVKYVGRLICCAEM